MTFMHRLRFVIERRYTAWGVAVLVGLICVLPALVFIISLGPAYRGIPFTPIDNAVGYLAIMQEVADGHPLVASYPFFEYKQGYPMLPPTIAWIYVLASILVHASLTSVLIASFFILPSLLFLVVYAFAKKLLQDEQARAWQRELAAIAGGLMVSFGIELQSVHAVVSFLSGHGVDAASTVLWTRPVNPVSGAILLFIFLWALWSLAVERKRQFIWLAGIVLAGMMASYVFSWTLAAAILGVCGILAAIRGRWWVVKDSAWVFGLALLVSSPYWYMVAMASRLPWYAEAAARMGLIASRVPHVNAFVALTTVFCLGVFVWIRRRNTDGTSVTESWEWCGALLAGCWIAYNQQLITGREIWYYHYVQYTVPICYLLFVAMAWHALRPRYPRTWLAGMIGLCVLLISFGATLQATGYRRNVESYRTQQASADVFNYFKANAPKDCVILTNEEGYWWSEHLLAFTSCNDYAPVERSIIAPPERFLHNEMTILRLRGITGEEIREYVSTHREDMHVMLYGQLQFGLGAPDPRFDKIMETFSSDYIAFLQNDFRQELERYRLDYILSAGPLLPSVLASVGPVDVVLEHHGMVVYRLK